MTTRSPITVSFQTHLLRLTIPTGTRTVPAHNQPLGQDGRRQRWVRPWRGLSGNARRFVAEVGVLLSESEVKAGA